MGFKTLAAFDLDIQALPPFELFQYLLQSGDTFSRKARAKPASRIQFTQLSQGKFYRAAGLIKIGGTIQSIIVQNNKLTVGTKLDIKFDPFRSGFQGFMKSSHSVFGGVSASATMPTNQGDFSFRTNFQ